MDRQIPHRKIEQIVKVAASAPSAHNAQPWRFIIIDDDEVKRSLAIAMGKKFREDLEKDGIPKEQREKMVANSVIRFSEAPVLIIPCLTMKEMELYRDERQESEYLMGVQSVSAAITTLLLYAYAEGLGTCWYCAPLFCKETVREILDIPRDVEPQALITMGYLGEESSKPSRRPLDEIIHLNRWGRKSGGG